ncbi:MAG TPA: glycosyltransferase family 39 protein [Anaerolineae bacterium]|nr:glycosyltransferase family 39 protein [Anaerolineae bacterium]HQH39321.1 glycosyltransferase family 39 protein [Anaerolineae bacterium]
MKHKLQNILSAPTAWAILLTVLYLAILALRPAEAFFGVPGEWTWAGRPPSPSTLPRWWPAIVALTLTAVISIVLDKRWEGMSRRQHMAALGFLVVGIPLTQILLKYIHYRYPIEFYLYRTIGPHNGFWQVAISIDALSDYLRTYPAQMLAMDDVFEHLTTHPPGNILYLWLWRKGFEAFPGLAHAVAHWLRGYNCADLAFVSKPDAHIAAALGQMCIPLFSGLTVLPLYAWAKRLGGTRAGWRAATLFALIPALSLFTLRWDSLYPLFAATAFAALHRGLSENKPLAWFLSGLSVSLASFCSFGNAPLAPGVALYAAAYLWQHGPRAIVRAWRGWLALLLGGYSVWGVFRLTTGVALGDLLTITGAIQAALRDHYSYGQWLFYNVYDILAFVGVPVGVWFVAESLHAWKLWLRRQATGVILPALVVSSVLLAVNLAGVSPGEVGRLWMFWMTGMVVAAVLGLQRRPDKARHHYAKIVALMALQNLWMTLFLRVTPTGMPAYTPRQPGSPTIAAPLEVTEVTFEHNIRLVGYTVTPLSTTPGATVNVTLYWQAHERPDLPYTVFVHLVDGYGTMQAQNDSMPVGNSLPTSCWLPEEVVADVHPVVIPAQTPPGAYTVHAGLYDLPTMTRLALTAGGEGDFFELPVTIAVQ